ncbi:CCH2R-like protein, partial [Mya arenaria]
KSNMNGSNVDQLLWDLNNKKAILFIPAIAFLGLLMILGTIGNILVLYFYGHKSKPSPSTSFIFTLAVFDILSCVVGMPMEIADLRFFFNFKSEVACKILRFITHFASISSALSLVVIAVDRFRRICRPFQRQLHIKHVKHLCVSVGVVSVLLSWPALVFNEIVEYDVKTRDGTIVTGNDCTTTKRESYQPYLLAVNIVYVVAFVAISIILGVLYVMISRQLYRHKKFRFYVAKKGTRVKRIEVRARDLSRQALLKDTTKVNASEGEIDGARSSVAGLKETVGGDITEIETDRPTSAYTAVTGTTLLTGMTDVTGMSKRSTSMKSVTIDQSQNRVYSIEAREGKRRNRIFREETERPGSGSSFATFTSRPSSATFSSISDVPKPRANIAFVGRNSRIEEEGSYEVDEDGIRDDDNGADLEEEKLKRERNFGHNLERYFSSREKTREWINKTIGYHSPIQNEENVMKDILHEEQTANDLENENKDNSKLQNDETRQVASLDSKQAPLSPKKSNEQGENDMNVEEIVQPTEGTAEDERPQSRLSSKSKKTKSSVVSRRSNVVTPQTDVTTASSVASRASTVRRLRRMLRDSVFKGGRLDADIDNVKDLRMKMLDINTIGIRSFFLNSSLNPVIYGGFNSQFRAFFYKMMCCCCLWGKRRKKRQGRDHSDSTSAS